MRRGLELRFELFFQDLGRLSPKNLPLKREPPTDVLRECQARLFGERHTSLLGLGVYIQLIFRLSTVFQVVDSGKLKLPRPDF